MINQLDPAAEAKRICQDVLQLNKMGTAAYRPPRAVPSGSKSKTVSQQQLQRRRKVQQIRKKAQEDCKNATEGLNPKRKNEIMGLKQRRRKVQEQLRQKQFQIKRLQEKRTSVDARQRCSVDQQHLHQFAVFRANTLTKVLGNLFFRAAKFSFIHLHKQVYYIASCMQRKAVGLHVKLMYRVAAKFLRVLKENRQQRLKARQTEQEQKRLQELREKMQLSEDFYQFTLLRKSVKALKKNKVEQAQAQHFMLFSSPQAQLGKVKALVRELKQKQKQQQQQQQDLQSLLPIAEEEESSRMQSDCMQPKGRQEQENPNRKSISNGEMSKKTREIEERNKKRKETIQLKKKQREAKRQQQLRKQEEEEKRLKQEERQRKLQELKKFEARRRAEEERKRRKEEEQKTEALKMEYAGKYHQRSILKFSGFLLLKQAMRVLLSMRQKRLKEFRQKRTERAWFYLQQGIQIQRQQNQQNLTKLKVRADSFKVIWLKRKLIRFLNRHLLLQKQHCQRLDVFHQVRLLKRTFRLWKFITPQIAHDNLVWEAQACQRVDQLIRARLGRKTISVLKGNMKACNQQRVQEMYQRQLRGKVNEWLQECSGHDIQRYLTD